MWNSGGARGGAQALLGRFALVLGVLLPRLYQLGVVLPFSLRAHDERHGGLGKCARDSRYTWVDCLFFKLEKPL